MCGICIAFWAQLLDYEVLGANAQVQVGEPHGLQLVLVHAAALLDAVCDQHLDKVFLYVHS